MSGCSFPLTKRVPIQSSQQTKNYHEIETKLHDVFDNFSMVDQQILKSYEGGEFLQYNPEKLIKTREDMYVLSTLRSCEEGDDECVLMEPRAFRENVPEGFVLGDCDELNGCLIIDPPTPSVPLKKLTNIVNFYAFGKDLYTVGNVPGSDIYSIFKNDDEIFSQPMDFGANGPVSEAVMIGGSPSFTYIDLKGRNHEGDPIGLYENIWYNGETFNEKYGVDISSHPFSYNGKIGFVGQKDGKIFLFFNGQPVSEGFDEVITHSCCMIKAYPIEVDEDGTLFFMAKRGEKYFFVEVDLNVYLD